MTFVQVLRFQRVYIALQLLLLLLLLPLPLLSSSPCPFTVEERVVATKSDAKTLAEALLCDGPASFTVSWHGGVIMLSQTLSVSNGSTLNVAGSESKDDAETGAVVTSDGTLLLFEVDLGSTVSLTGLTFSGLRVTGGSFVEIIDCTFTNNKRTLSHRGGELFFLLFFFHLTYSRWTSSLPSCLWSQRIFPSLPGSRLTIFLSRCKFSTLTTRQPMVEFYLLTFPRFPLRKKEHKSYFGKNRTHDFRTTK